MNSSWLIIVPTWITAAAVVFAAAQYLSDRSSRRAERDRLRRAQATKISAWAAQDQHANSYGIVISNRSGSTFHNVSVIAVMHSIKDIAPVELLVLPPGDFFVEWAGKPGDFQWEFAKDVAECADVLRPLTRSRKHQVLELSFTDNLNQKWKADQHLVLRPE